MKSLPITLRSSGDFEAVEAQIRKNWLEDKKATVPNIEIVLLRSQVPHVIGVMKANDFEKMSETIEKLGFAVERKFQAVTGAARSMIGVVR